ncbi:10742_t:CDS:2 [Scutellospora calospora]|uniref:10742_t:CDS:1 n=1 Tax=Scutellospora calospora TaxID=85575 RepID=A0ACA9KBU6_9GLOM|nr:10742_t:CDS:2 [Scutellospora calospora]
MQSPAALNLKDQYEGNEPKLKAEDFIELIKRKDPQLKGFFNLLYNAMNPQKKNIKTQENLKQKVISGASAHCIDIVANMGLCTTYQMAFNKLNQINDEHYTGLNNLLIACINDYHNLYGTHILTTNSTSQIVTMVIILFNSIESTPVLYYSRYGLPMHNPCGIDPIVTISKNQIGVRHLTYHMKLM